MAVRAKPKVAQWSVLAMVEQGLVQYHTLASSCGLCSSTGMPVHCSAAEIASPPLTTDTRSLCMEPPLSRERRLGDFWCPLSLILSVFSVSYDKRDSLLPQFVLPYVQCPTILLVLFRDFFPFHSLCASAPPDCL
jgi:hypothetical protein